MLDDGASGERSKCAVARRAVPRPARARALIAVDRRPQGQHVWHPTHDELVLQVVKPVQILEDEAKLAHQLRVFEVILEVRVSFGYEQRVVRRERGDKGRIEREIILRWMACPTGSAVATERFVEEDPPSLCNLVDWSRGRRIAGREEGHTSGERADRQWRSCAGLPRTPILRCHTSLLKIASRNTVRTTGCIALQGQPLQRFHCLCWRLRRPRRGQRQGLERPLRSAQARSFARAPHAHRGCLW